MKNIFAIACLVGTIFAATSASAAPVTVSGAVGIASPVDNQSNRDSDAAYAVKATVPVEVTQFGPLKKFDVGVEVLTLENNKGPSKAELTVASVVLEKQFDSVAYYNVTPYVSGSLGYAWGDGNAVVRSKENGLAATVGVGVLYPLNDRLKITAGYQWVRAFDTSVVGNGNRQQDFENNVARVGLSFRL